MPRAVSVLSCFSSFLPGACRGRRRGRGAHNERGRGRGDAGVLGEGTDEIRDEMGCRSTRHRESAHSRAGRPQQVASSKDIAPMRRRWTFASSRSASPPLPAPPPLGCRGVTAAAPRSLSPQPTLLGTRTHVGHNGEAMAGDTSDGGGLVLPLHSGGARRSGREGVSPTERHFC